MQRATAMPGKRAAYHDKSEPVQNRLYRSLRVWSMYADLEESLGTFEVSGQCLLPLMTLALQRTVEHNCTYCKPATVVVKDSSIL